MLHRKSSLRWQDRTQAVCAQHTPSSIFSRRCARSTYHECFKVSVITARCSCASAASRWFARDARCNCHTWFLANSVATHLVKNHLHRSLARKRADEVPTKDSVLRATEKNFAWSGVSCSSLVQLRPTRCDCNKQRLSDV